MRSRRLQESRRQLRISLNTGIFITTNCFSRHLSLIPTTTLLSYIKEKVFLISQNWKNIMCFQKLSVEIFNLYLRVFCIDLIGLDIYKNHKIISCRIPTEKETGVLTYYIEYWSNGLLIRHIIGNMKHGNLIDNPGPNFSTLRVCQYFSNPAYLPHNQCVLKFKEVHFFYGALFLSTIHSTTRNSLYNFQVKNIRLCHVPYK